MPKKKFVRRHLSEGEKVANMNRLDRMQLTASVERDRKVFESLLRKERSYSDKWLQQNKRT